MMRVIFTFLCVFFLFSCCNCNRDAVSEEISYHSVKLRVLPKDPNPSVIYSLEFTSLPNTTQASLFSCGCFNYLLTNDLTDLKIYRIADGVKEDVSRFFVGRTEGVEGYFPDRALFEDVITLRENFKNRAESIGSLCYINLIQKDGDFPAGTKLQFVVSFADGQIFENQIKV